MGTSLLKDFVKMVALFGLLWAGFMFLTKWYPEYLRPDVGIDDEIISIENEEKLGDLMLENLLLADGAELRGNRFLDSVMWVIESRLLSGIDSTEYEFSFYVLDSPEINAITIPGGNILVFKGLLEFADTPEQVAAVLAHEIGHAQKRHVVTKLVRELGLAFVVGVITGGDATLIHEVAQTAVSNTFSRNHEEEADGYGMQLLLKSNIDPRALAAFFRKMNRENMGFDERLEWIASHPHNNSRIQKSLEFEVPEDFQPKPFELQWDSLKATL